MAKLAFHEFCRELAKARGDYPLPEGTPLLDAHDVIDTPGRGKMSVTDIAAYLCMPVDAFRWCYACWQHHLRMADLH